jgi:TolA-binding protein
MNKLSQGTIAFIVVVLILTIFISYKKPKTKEEIYYSSEEIAEDKIKELEDQIDELNYTIYELEEENEELQSTVEFLESNNEDLQDEIDSLVY